MWNTSEYIYEYLAIQRSVFVNVNINRLHVLVFLDEI